MNPRDSISMSSSTHNSNNMSMSLKDMLSSTTIGSSLYQDMNREDAEGLLEIGRHRGVEAAPNAAAAASEIEIEERLTAVTAKVDEMKLRHGEEVRRLAAENERLRRRNDELEARAQAAADGRRTEPGLEEATTDDVPALCCKLRDANTEIRSLRSQLAEVQRRSDETRDILEERLESALQDSYDQKIDHLSQTTALRRDLADLYREQEADTWAYAASQNFALDMERDHRKDTVSLMRSRMEKELTEKVELIESLREAVARRDRNVEALTGDLEEVREQLKQVGRMPRRGSQLEGTVPRETGLFSQLHQALGVPESSSPAPPSQPTSIVGNHVGEPETPQGETQDVIPVIKQDISPGSMPIPDVPRRNSTTPQVA